MIGIDAVPAVVVVDGRQRRRRRTAWSGVAGFVPRAIADDGTAGVVVSVGGGVAGFGSCLSVVEIRLQRGLFRLLGGGLFGVHVLLFTSHKAITHPVAHKNDF
jgi:hypothetical protein